MDKKTDHEFDMQFFESVLRRSPDYTEVIEILGGLYTKHGRIADGLRMDRKLVLFLPENATAHYNLACSLALLNRKADALRTLNDMGGNVLGTFVTEVRGQDPESDRRLAYESSPEDDGE